MSKKPKKETCTTTFDVLTDRVGTGGQTKGIQVRRVEELLKLAGYFKGTPNGTWDAKTSAALLAFQADIATARHFRAEDFIDPEDKDNKLMALMWKAGVVSLVPGFCRGKPAVLALYHALRLQNIPYGWTQNGTKHHGGSRMVWGWEGHPNHVVYTEAGTNPETMHFRTDWPKTLNCTSFANLMLSVWMRGDAHGPPYLASQAVGGWKPLGRRYNMEPVPGGIKVESGSGGVFNSLDKLRKQLVAGKLYHFAAFNTKTGITHDMVLLDDTVYECNLTQGEGKSSVYSTPLEQRFKKGKLVQVHGPAAG